MQYFKTQISLAFARLVGESEKRGDFSHESEKKSPVYEFSSPVEMVFVKMVIETLNFLSIYIKLAYHATLLQLSYF